MPPSQNGGKKPAPWLPKEIKGMTKEQLTQKKEELDGAARRATHRTIALMLLYLAAQNGVFFYGTFFVWSWDIMEPIAYFWGQCFIVLCFAYFIRSERECGFGECRNARWTQSAGEGTGEKGLILTNTSATAQRSSSIGSGSAPLRKSVYRMPVPLRPCGDV